MKSLLILSVFAILYSVVIGIEDVPAQATRALPPPGPDGMITLSGKTRSGSGYTYSSMPASFASAMEKCKSTGRKLLAIENLAEQNQVSVLLASYGIGARTWTSGMELSPDNLVWATTFDPIEYNNIGNTNVYQSNNCLSVHNSGPNRFKWWYTKCSWEYNFVCEQ